MQNRVAEKVDTIIVESGPEIKKALKSLDEHLAKLRKLCTAAPEGTGLSFLHDQDIFVILNFRSNGAISSSIIQDRKEAETLRATLIEDLDEATHAGFNINCINEPMDGSNC